MDCQWEHILLKSTSVMPVTTNRQLTKQRQNNFILLFSSLSAAAKHERGLLPIEVQITHPFLPTA